MSIEKEDTIILTIHKSAHANRAEVNEMVENIAKLEASIHEIRVKLVKSAERYREALDYLVAYHPEGADDWLKHMGADRETLLRFEAYNQS